MRAIDNELTELQLQYDSRLLATAMIHKAVYMLRMLVAAGKWTPEDVQVVMMEGLADVHVPLDVSPKVMVRPSGDLPG